MIIEEYYKNITREFKAVCLVGTKMHEVGKEYKVITFAKPDSFIYVEDERSFQHLTYSSFFEFLENFNIV
jgi:hypothetical protein